jgi:hypothetical protein
MLPPKAAGETDGPTFQSPHSLRTSTVKLEGTSKNGPVSDLLSMAPDVSLVRRIQRSEVAKNTHSIS